MNAVRTRRLRAALAPVTIASTLALSVAGTQAQAPPPEPSLFDPAVLHDFRFAFEDADWEARLASLGSDAYVYADLEADGETAEDVGLRIKGNSSARGSGRKVPLNVTIDARVDGQELLGYDTLNLNSGFADPTFARETLTTQVLADYMPMPATAYARVHADGAYFGLYTLVEQVEGTFLGAWFETNDGLLFKADAPGGAGGPGGGFRSDLTWLGDDIGAYRAAYELKTADAGDAAYEALRELTRVLDAPTSAGGVTDDAFPAAARQVLDVDGALWYLAAMNLYTNFDSYYAGHNYFLYRAEEDGRFHVLAWDVNESFGVFPGAGIDPANTQAVAETDPFLMATGTRAAARPLVRRLLAAPELRADYLAHYRTLLAETFDPAALEGRVRGYQDLIREAVRVDPNRIYTFEDFERGVTEDLRVGGSGGRGGRAVPGLLKLARLRQAWLAARPDLQAPELTLTLHTRLPEAPTVADAPRVTLAFAGADLPVAVQLFARVDGSAPLVLDMAREGDAWTATLPAAGRGDVVSYYARAVLADGRVAFHPPANQTRPWTYEVTGAALPTGPAGDLVINEVLADNATVLADAAGEFDDWVELVNRGPSPVGLGGYYLSDDAEDPWAYALPDVTLPPGGRYLVWCDNDPDQGADHAGFGLAKDGETVALSTLAATVDEVAFPALAPDVAYARRPDGGEAWSVCGQPSPGEPNACEGPLPRHDVFLPFAGRR